MNESTKIQKEQIIRDFGLQIEEVEPLVYKVTNNIDIVIVDLKNKLEECRLITGNTTHIQRDGTQVRKGRVHLIDLGNSTFTSEYQDLLTSQGIEAVYEPYNIHAFSENSIDTIYGAWEV